MRESRTPALATEPLLLIHATAGAWRPVMSRLSEHHEVIALDLPGFGKAPARSPAVPDLADAVEEQLDEKGLDTAYLAGSSLGGWVALELARRGRARTVTAISPIGLGSERENRRARRRMRLAHAAAPAARPFVRPVARTAVGRTL